MAHSHIVLQHPSTMHTVTAPVGFSWTALFFGFALLAYHGSYVTSALLAVITLILGPIPNLVICWFYNKNRIVDLWKEGYRVIAIDSELSREELIAELDIPLNRVQLNG